MQFPTFWRSVFLLSLMALSGCGGGGSQNLLSSESGQTVTFGGSVDSLVTRIAGTAQPPVASGGSGAVVTGVAGGLVSNLLFHRANATLAETRIAFQSFRDGNYEIYTMNLDGTGQTRLTNNSAVDAAPVWSPDGSKIAFYSNRDGNSEIYTMYADGTGQTRLTSNSSLDYYPSWSPDGTKIAFTSDRDGNREIYVMNADGAGQTRLTSNSTDDDGATWSPDGTRIAFHSLRDGNWEIYSMNANGSGQTRLTNSSGTDSDPSWSPDGSKIAFTSRRDNNYEIYVMNADGTGQINITNNASDDSDPSWSPDGSKIAFTSRRDVSYELYSVNANGTGLSRLTNNTDIDIVPRWSPLLSRRELIGGNGLLGPAAAGFLYGQSNDAITSVLTFDTADASRVKTRISTLTGVVPGLSNYVFTITASDALTRLSYVNGAYGSPKVVVGPGGLSSAPSGAIVSFNATGQVSSVLPYISNRSAVGTPAASAESGVQVLRGHFLGVWNEMGQNAAPNGASEVRMDTSTGKVISFR